MNVKPTQSHIGRHKPHLSLKLVQENFQKWDLDSDGQIDRFEMWTNVSDSQFKGDTAVALCALLRHQNSKRGEGELPALSEKDLKEIATDPALRDNLEERFDRYQGYLKETSPELFEPGGPDPEAIHQHFSPSCCFLTPMYAALKSDPNILSDVITESETGYRVAFPNSQRTVEVPSPSDAELIMHGSARGNGRWLAVAEKAMASLHVLSPFPEPGEIFHARPNPFLVNFYLKGAASTYVPVPTSATSTSAVEADPTEVPDFLQSAVESLERKRCVLAFTAKPSKKGLIKNHAYNITSFDRSKQLVVLRNPHAKNEPVDSNDEPIDGKDDGHFALSLQDFVENFPQMMVEEEKLDTRKANSDRNRTELDRYRKDHYAHMTE